MHFTNRMIYATSQEILECQNNPKAFRDFIALVKASGWLGCRVAEMSRNYRKADHSEWTSFILHGLWKSIERANPTINISNLLILSVYWGKSEYKKLYHNKAQKTEDNCDAMEHTNEDGEKVEFDLPSIDPKYEDMEIKEFLKKMEIELEPREMSIFREIMENETTLRDLGKSLGMSHERCRQIMGKARKKAIRLLAKAKDISYQECLSMHTGKAVKA